MGKWECQIFLSVLVVFVLALTAAAAGGLYFDCMETSGTGKAKYFTNPTKHKTQRPRKPLTQHSARAKHQAHKADVSRKRIV